MQNGTFQFSAVLYLMPVKRDFSCSENLAFHSGTEVRGHLIQLSCTLRWHTEGHWGWTVWCLVVKCLQMLPKNMYKLWFLEACRLAKSGQIFYIMRRVYLSYKNIVQPDWKLLIQGREVVTVFQRKSFQGPFSPGLFMVEKCSSYSLTFF